MNYCFKNTDCCLTYFGVNYTFNAAFLIYRENKCSHTDSPGAHQISPAHSSIHLFLFIPSPSSLFLSLKYSSYTFFSNIFQKFSAGEHKSFFLVLITFCTHICLLFLLLYLFLHSSGTPERQSGRP